MEHFQDAQFKTFLHILSEFRWGGGGCLISLMQTLGAEPLLP